MEMQKIKCFDYILHKFRCDKSIYENSSLNNAINQLLECEFANSTEVPEGTGDVKTTVGKEKNILDYTQETKDLLDWIKIQICSIKKYSQYQKNKIKFTRNWVNQMSKGSMGQVHAHTMGTNADGVAIFYVKNSKLGSKLIIAKKLQEDTNYLNYATEDLYFIDTNSGDLIIHDYDVPHAVSVHNDEEPRICIVLEFILD